MRKIRLLLLIAMGASMLISAFTSGISMGPQDTYAMTLQGKSMATQQLLTSSSCMLCHNSLLQPGDQDFIAKNYSSNDATLQDQLFDKAVISQHSESEHANALDPETIYAILTAPYAEQSIRMQDYTGPIIQCGFCHSQMPMQASTLIGEIE